MATVTLHVDDPEIGQISPLLHGHFAEHLGRCIYDGLWTGTQLNEPVIEALQRINPPVVRWPGGCFADDYHWRDGIGPWSGRPRTVNIHWGQTVEDNSFGTHEFLALCRRLGAEPYLAGNVGSGTPQELRDWVEYCNFAGDSRLAQERAANGSPAPFGVRWWGVGNENWGCGGDMAPDDYCREYKRFAVFLRDYSETSLQLVACGPNGFDLEWTRRFFAKLKDYGAPRLHAFAAHYYCGTAGTATQYTEAQWYELLKSARRIEELVVRTRTLMDGHDPERKIKLLVDEWGTWHTPTPGQNPAWLFQQSTVRDALVAAMSLDIFHNHADKIAMANIAQFVNVLQAMVLTDGDRLLCTPTYHVFDLYQKHRGGQALRPRIDAGEAAPGVPVLSGSGSRHGDQIVLTLVNSSASDAVPVVVALRGASGQIVAATTLCGPDIQAHNTFEQPNQVTPKPLSAAPDRLVLPAASVTLIEMRMGAT